MIRAILIFWLLSVGVLFCAVSRLPICAYPFLSYQRFIPVQLDGRDYLALVDTGSAFSMLKKETLSEIPNKLFISNSEFIAIKGNKYITANFMIDQIKIGDFITQNIFKEEDESFWSDGSLLETPSLIQSLKIYLMHQVFRSAMIGIDLFQKFACVFDFPHSSIFLANHISEILDRNNYNPIPFEMGKAGIILKIDTFMGVKRFLLDSAATKSLIQLPNQKNQCDEKGCISIQLNCNGFDLGLWDFDIFEFPTQFDDIDGILGIDFFKKSTIGVDFINKLIYINFPKLGSKERFTYWLKSYFGL